jgi:hypothetical protein
MITNLFHSNSDLKGINIERLQDGSFVLCVAYKEKGKWTAKALTGIFGDLEDKKLVEHAIKNGKTLDKETALKIFSSLSKSFDDYLTN